MIAEAEDGYLTDYSQSDKEVFRRQIIESIDKGKPVVAFGVEGPTEACIITGYDQDGDVLIGWSMIQEHLDPVHDIG